MRGILAVVGKPIYNTPSHRGCTGVPTGGEGSVVSQGIAPPLPAISARRATTTRLSSGRVTPICNNCQTTGGVTNEVSTLVVLRPSVRHASLLVETIGGAPDAAEEGGHESQLLQLFVGRGDPELRRTSFPVHTPRCEESGTVGKSHGDGEGNVGQVGQGEGVRGSLPFCVPNFIVRGGTFVSLFAHTLGLRITAPA